MEYKHLSTINETKRLNLNTMNFGKIPLAYCWKSLEPDKTVIAISGIGDIDLTAAIHFDIEGFEGLNEQNDERHQISIETLKGVEIDVIEGPIPRLRIYYAFHQDGNFWRTAVGWEHDISIDRSSNNVSPQRYYALAFASNARCTVFW